VFGELKVPLLGKKKKKGGIVTGVGKRAVMGEGSTNYMHRKRDEEKPPGGMQRGEHTQNKEKEGEGANIPEPEWQKVVGFPGHCWPNKSQNCCRKKGIVGGVKSKRGIKDRRRGSLGDS